MKTLLVAGALVALAVPSAAAVSLDSRAVNYLMAQSMCPRGTVTDASVDQAVAIAVKVSGTSETEHLVMLASRAHAARDRVLSSGSVDAFCRDFKTATAAQQRSF